MPRKKTFPLCMHKTKSFHQFMHRKKNISSIYAQKERHFINLCKEIKCKERNISLIYAERNQIYKREIISLIYAKREIISLIYAERNHFLNLCKEKTTFP